jgi:hypothetical protein
LGAFFAISSFTEGFFGLATGLGFGAFAAGTFGKIF